MIFENQTDLLVQSFQLQSENLANRLLQDFEEPIPEPQSDTARENLLTKLRFYEAAGMRVLSKEGEVILQSPATLDPEMFQTKKTIEEKIQELNLVSANSVFETKYDLDLLEEDFSIVITLPIRTESGNVYLLQAKILLSGIQERLRQIYIFMGIATSWGIIFHILFAIFVYRVIFYRLHLLKEASIGLSSGDLSTRANWNSKKQDELDDLGMSFNLMADRIQETVQTISRLNYEINQELLIGKEVQELFLPRKKKFKEFAPGLLYHPMREVSGDIYLFFKKKTESGEKSFFLIADASGHGVSAALVTVTIALFLEAIIKETEEPHEVISRLSDLLGSRMQASFFATGVFYSWDGRELKVCNAGHNEPILFHRAKGSRETIPSSGPPLGMVEDHVYKTESYYPDSGDKIFSYTDGLTESTDSQEEMFGLERVSSFLNHEYVFSHENQEIVDGLFSELDRFKESYKDDVTLLIWEIP